MSNQENYLKQGNYIENSDVSVISKLTIQLPSVNARQNYINWRVSSFNNMVLFNFIGINGAQIYCPQITLADVLRFMQSDLENNVERNTYQFQSDEAKHVANQLRNRKGRNNENTVAFKYFRVNFKKKIALLFQNTYDYRTGTKGSLLERYGINIDIDILMGILPHISVIKAQPLIPDQSSEYDNDV